MTLLVLQETIALRTKDLDTVQRYASLWYMQLTVNVVHLL
jgi:hypothetical protein